jgi:hypothetical protein
VFALLQLLALLRYADAVNWDALSAWVIILFLASYLIVGFYGWRAAGPDNRANADVER